MKIKVELFWWNGILVDGESEDHPEPDYEIVDADTGHQLLDYPLRSYEEVEAYIATTFPDCERWTPPPSPDDAVKLEKILAIVEFPSGEVALDERVVRNFLVGQLYQNGYPEPVVTRIRAVLGRLGTQNGAGVGRQSSNQ